jgi:hypothetical protein
MPAFAANRGCVAISESGSIGEDFPVFAAASRMTFYLMTAWRSGCAALVAETELGAA